MNPLFNALNKQNQNGNLLDNFSNFQNRFNEFAAQFSRNSKITPQQKVQEMLNSGQMSQEQFNNFREIANRITGKHY